MLTKTELYFLREIVRMFNEWAQDASCDEQDVEPTEENILMLRKQYEFFGEDSYEIDELVSPRNHKLYWYGSSCSRYLMHRIDEEMKGIKDVQSN